MQAESLLKFSMARNILSILAALAILSPEPARAQAAFIPKMERDIAAQLVPHKALYDIRMTSKSSASQVVNISGKMYFEWRPACDAWATDHRFTLNYEYVDSPATRVTSDFSTYEPFDGKSLDFSARRRRDGELFEEVRGRAEMAVDGAGSAVYSLPGAVSHDLPSGALFPTGHTIALLKAIGEGRKFFSAVVFDGSDEEGPVEINSVVGRAVKAPPRPAKPGDAVDSKLLRSPAWGVRMAFFPLKYAKAGPDYEMNVVFHENGVISDMMVDYHDFSVTQKLVALGRLKAVDCKEKAAPPPSGRGAEKK